MARWCEHLASSDIAAAGRGRYLVADFLITLIECHHDRG